MGLKRTLSSSLRLLREPEYEEYPGDLRTATRLSRKTNLIDEPSEVAIAMTGGVVQDPKEGYLSLKSSNSRLSTWKRKHFVLRNSTLKIFNPKEWEKHDLDAVEEFSISLSDIKKIGYEKDGDSRFTLELDSDIFVDTRGSQRWSTLTRSRSARSSGWTNSIRSSTEPVGASSNVQKLYLKAKSAEDAEAWVQHLIIEIQNLAVFMDKTVDHLITKNGNQETVETLLRNSIDLWSLAKGKVHGSTAHAQERLMKWLDKNDHMDEAHYWSMSSRNIRKQLNQEANCLNKTGYNPAKQVTADTDFAASKTRKSGIKKIQDRIDTLSLFKCSDAVSVDKMIHSL